MSRAGKQATAKLVALAIISQVVLFSSAAEARGGGGHGGGGHAGGAVAGSGGGGSSNGGGSGSSFHPNPNGPYSGNNLGSSSYASPQQNNTFVPRQDVGHARRYGGGGGYGRYNNNYGNYGNQNQMAPPPSQYQTQVFSGPAYISPVGYHNYVKSYSWPSAADTLPESSAAGQAATAQLMQSR